MSFSDLESAFEVVKERSDPGLFTAPFCVLNLSSRRRNSGITTVKKSRGGGSFRPCFSYFVFVSSVGQEKRRFFLAGAQCLSPGT